MGAGRPSAFTPVAGVCVGEAGGGPLGPPSLGDVGSLCAPLQLPVSRPLPRLPTSTVPICGAPGSPALLPSRALGPDVQTGAAGVARCSGCRLTGMSQARRGRSGCVWGSGIWDFGTRCLVLSPVQGTDEFYLGIAYCWKCELASLSIHTHQIFACLRRVEPGIAFQRFAPQNLPSSLSVAAPVRWLHNPFPRIDTDHPHLLPPVTLFQTSPSSPHLPCTCSFHQLRCAVPQLPTRLQPFCLEIFVPRTLISYGRPTHLLALRESWIRGHELVGVRGQVSSGGCTPICFLTLLLYPGGPL